MLCTGVNDDGTRKAMEDQVPNPPFYRPSALLEKLKCMNQHLWDEHGKEIPRPTAHWRSIAVQKQKKLVRAVRDQ